jgi:hypothetical protein
MIKLQFETTTAPDFGGFMFYVEYGRLFDAYDYAEAYSLNRADRADLDAQDVHAVQDAAGQLNAGEWLEVSHETDPARVYKLFWIAPDGIGEIPMGEYPSREEAGAYVPEGEAELLSACADDEQRENIIRGRWAVVDDDECWYVQDIENEEG